MSNKKIVVQESSGISFFALGLFLGGLGGAILALLNAPRSGKETRTQIVDAAEDTVDTVRETVRERIQGEDPNAIIAASKEEARRMNGRVTTPTAPLK